MPRVIECFSSLQGESTQAGRRCFFIRLEGCNLNCSYCDTEYARSGGVEKSVSELVELAVASKVPLVEITGGEPLLEKELPELCSRLMDRGLEVMIETNGSMDVSVIPEGVRRIIDCKLPGSGMDKFNMYGNFSGLTALDEVKFVVSSKEDFDFALEVISRCGLEESPAALLASPVWGRVSFEELAGWVIESGSRLRMQLQMHKLIWGDKKGV
ncbi:MAG: radical SAM protein [Lentisphaeria bacterium]|nr:radical SAM protein [Lentisphaerota bacterium]MBO5645454.1 radical SAM protein [Lentisphaeria bacterium]MBO5764910.1 radical SAM protein [Lentisphaeria bacterium]MBO5900016.1 radical SAM protein [Lentisphaeria bacterium]MBO5990549.1 radical SAM protein [Lentisphaeria bacterium]